MLDRSGLRQRLGTRGRSVPKKAAGSRPRGFAVASLPCFIRFLRIGSFRAEEKATEERPVARDDPVAKVDEPDERTAPGEADGARMPVSLVQGKEYRPASGEMAAIGGHDLDSVAGLLAQRGSHGRARTLLIGNNLESLLLVTPPEPGGSSSSELSPTVPDEPVLPFHGAYYASPDEFA